MDDFRIEDFNDKKYRITVNNTSYFHTSDIDICRNCDIIMVA